MAGDPIEPLVSRLIAERADAYRRYNEALTALDRAIQWPVDVPSAPTPYDDQLLPRINDSWRIVPEGGPAPVPGWKSRFGDFVWKLMSPPFERQMAFNAALVDHLNRNVHAHRTAQQTLATSLAMMRESFDALARFESLLVQFLQRITPLADARDREILESIEQLRHVAEIAQRAAVTAKREIDRVVSTGSVGAARPLDAAAGGNAASASSDAYKYLGFEDRFRGSEDDIRARLAAYLAYFDGASNVLDVGCGRGEFLDLLRQRGVPAAGIDLNPEMVELCRARGLDVSASDALTYLRGIADESLGGLIAVQVVEHLEPAYLSQLLQTAYFKLRPGSRMVLETINPACWVAFFESYIRDLTHVKPIHPETLQFMLQASGFGSVEIIYRAPISDEAKLERVRPLPEHFGETAEDAMTQLVSSFNRNMDRLNARLFTYQDFAAIATKQ